MIIYRYGNDATIRFAAQECARYLKQMTGNPVGNRAGSERTWTLDGIHLGLPSVLPHIKGMLPVESEQEDTVLVRIVGGKGVITGSNPRSVLFATYQLLEKLGCRWLHPGKNGDAIPSGIKPVAISARLFNTASYSNRCICIEGSCSAQHVKDLIHYSAKRGFNAYFIQFRNAFTFFQRWYGEESQRGGKKARFSMKEANAICDVIKDEVVKRGLLLHSVGHGWTCEPFGIKGTEWKQTRQVISPSAQQYFAEIGGKRTLHGGIPLNTNLCYGNPEARTIMAKAVEEYAAENPRDNILHVWLGDGSNNNCECNLCRTARPSDWYVMLLNQIDERLTAAGSNTRIVFLAYVDLLWGPVRERLKNQNRFILMFAPITRSYSRSFLAVESSTEPPMDFKLNRLTFPVSPEANLELLKTWKSWFKGDCVDFDYHLWRSHIFDPGQMSLARVLFEDLRDLGKLGMNGFISCQAQRAFLPTGIWQHIMGKVLWNRSISFGTMVNAYFHDLYGKDGGRIRTYLESLSKAFHPPVLRGEVSEQKEIERAIRSIDSIPALIEEILPLIQQQSKRTLPAWQALEHYCWYARSLAAFLSVRLRGDRKQSRTIRLGIEKGLEQRLPAIGHLFDTFMAKNLLKHLEVVLPELEVKDQSEPPNLVTD